MNFQIVTHPLKPQTLPSPLTNSPNSTPISASLKSQGGRSKDIIPKSIEPQDPFTNPSVTTILPTRWKSPSVVHTVMLPMAVTAMGTGAIKIALIITLALKKPSLTVAFSWTALKMANRVMAPARSNWKGLNCKPRSRSPWTR